MVLERAARFEAEAGDSLSKEEKSREGMRLAAQYMRGEEVDFTTLLTKPAAEQALLMEGALTTLLRNISLPREEDDQAGANRAMGGMLQLGQDPQLQAVLGEMKKLLDHYLQHKTQLRGQIEEQFAAQMAKLEQSMGQKTGVQVKLEPTQHPKFVEEWQKVMVQLNEQYGNALDQQKAYIHQLLAS
jgi:hypothetical protein